MRLELTRRTDYAIRAMLALARHPGETLSSSDISELTRIPVRFVTQVMAHLVRAGLVHAVIGRSGGYRLTPRPGQVSVLAIVEAVEGDTRRQHCALSGGPCQGSAPCEIHSVFSGAQEAFIAQLAASTLATIMGEPGPVRPTGSNDPQPPGFAIRRVRPADRPLLVEFYAGLSAESRYARFLGFSSGVADAQARSFCTPDHTHDEGFVAVASDGRNDLIVGHLCLEPAGSKRIELAVAVSDEHQGRGLGRKLMEAAIEWARVHHFEAIIASAFADNFRVLRLLSSAPYPVHVAPADVGVVDVVVPLVAELLPDRPVVMPAALRASRRHGGRRRSIGPSRCSRVVWRGTRRPVRDAEGSASTGSS